MKLYPNAQLLVSTIWVNNEAVIRDIITLSKEINNVWLQFSIHESTDWKRNQLIPFVNKLSLQQISKVWQDWYNVVGRKPFINYCVHKDNSSQEDINNMKKIFDPSIFNVTLSVICEKDCWSLWNVSEQLDLITWFKNKLELYWYNIRVFNPAWQDDIWWGCGQLWFVQDWIKNYKSNLNK